jgi:type IV secretion system protein TrbE
MFNQLFNPAVKTLKRTLSGGAFAGNSFGLSDLLMYANLVDDGIVLQTDGSFIASFWYRGSDLETSTDSELSILSEQLNRAFNLIGSGWLFHVDMLRYHAMKYTDKADCFFTTDVPRMIDEERRNLYSKQSGHYENAYAISFTYKPKVDFGNKVGLFFRRETNSDANIDYSYHLRQFKNKISEITDLLAYQLNLEQMDSQMLVSYLSWCLTGESIDLQLPTKHRGFLKYFLASKDLIGGENPKIGDKYIKAITIMGFPNESYPGILDKLNYVDFEYRFSTRFILIGQHEGSKIIDRISSLWYQKRVNALDTMKMSLAIDTNVKVNQHSDSQYQDAETARALNESGDVKFGFYTATVIVMHENIKIAEQQSSQIRSIFRNLGFQSQVERHHAVEAFLGSLPGYSYANVRKWLINTLNMADIVPNTSIWSGLNYNPCSFYKDNNPPLFYARTTGYTPMRISLHVGDNGHTLILGPTGSGKSTLLNFIIAQHFRYKNARVFVFDKHCSSLPLCYGCGGVFYNIGQGENTLSFQPLANLESDLDFDFAAQWLEDVCILNGMLNRFDDTHRDAIRNGLRLMQNETPKERRTISYFRHLVQDYDKSIALILDSFSQEARFVNGGQPKAGFIAKIFDGNNQDFILEHSRFNVFEMGKLMEQGDRVVIPALRYLIHLINKQFDSCEPTLLVFDESFLFFKHPLFRDKIVEWIKTVRKFNVAIIFATQEVADLFKHDELRSALKTNCATKIFLPNRHALTEDIYTQYRSMDLNDKQINLVARGLKGEYFYCSELGNRKFNLDITDTPITFNFIARTSGQDINLAIAIKKKHKEQFVKYWLKAHNVTKAAE